MRRLSAENFYRGNTAFISTDKAGYVWRVGYVCPDETYAVINLWYNENSGEFESDAWCFMVSIGKNTASTLMNAYASLVAGCR